MKADEFFRRAKGDASFRDQQIAEAHDQKYAAVAMGIVLAVVWIGYAIYCVVALRRWPSEAGLGMGAVLCGSAYAQARTWLAGLEALQDAGNPVTARAEAVGSPGVAA